MSIPPSGTVTFLFTDIEGSTALWEQHPEAMQTALEQHHTILRESIASQHGVIFNTVGDGICAAFAAAGDACKAALIAQRSLRQTNWGETPIRVRMGLHTGAAEAATNDYHSGPTLNRVARIMSVAYGGQVLLSQTTADLLRGQLPVGVGLRDMGQHHFKGLADTKRLFQVVTSDLPSEFPALRSASSTPNNLPIQLTSFIGRAQELAELRDLLAGTRLLTLTGSGGTGKTRLSLQLAAAQLHNFQDGVWLVELAPLAEPDLIAQTVISALGVREQPGRLLLTTLTEYLNDKQLLLVLDNCEHLIAASARFSDALLHAAPHLKILASSREALGIAGERTYYVPSLPVPDLKGDLSVANLETYDAVRLFLERAAAARAGFMLTHANAAAVAQICSRLDGIPLAIELAAVRIKVFSAEQIPQRLDDCFRLLTGGSRTALPRQQTLRGTIDWSHSLLSEPERILLRRLSVFAGGWTLEAAESVCADEVGAELEPAQAVPPGQPRGLLIQRDDVLDLLTHLIERSLVVTEEELGETRYRMLETIRQYAREKLLESGDGEAVRARHMEFFVHYAELFDQQIWTSTGATWLSRMEAEQDNLRAAIDWSIHNGYSERGARLASAAWMWWQQRHPSEGLERFRGLLSAPGVGGRTSIRSLILRRAGALEYWQGNYSVSEQLATAALAIAREIGDQETIASTLKNLGQVAYVQRDYAAVRAFLSESLEIKRQTGLAYGDILLELGDLSRTEGALEQAQRLYEESAAIMRSEGDKYSLGMPLRRLGQMALETGDYQHAHEYIRESLALNVELNDRRGIATCLTAQAALAAALGRDAAAVRLHGAAYALLESDHVRLVFFDHVLAERNLADLRSALDASTFDSAWEAGRAMTLAQALDFALKAVENVSS